MIGLLLLTSSVFAQDQDDDKGESEAELVSGPPAGTAATAVMAYAPVGARAGEEYDAIASIGDGPGALLFIHELTRNGLPVIRAIDQAAAELSLLGLHTSTLILSDDRTAMETKLKGVNGSLKLHNPIVLSLDGADGPGNYALNRKAVLTLVILDKGKVVRSTAFTDVNEKDSASVREWIATVTGPLPDDPKELRALAESSLPADGAELRKVATAQTLELQQLRSQVAQLKQRLQEANYAARMGGARPRPDAPRMERGGERPNPDKATEVKNTPSESSPKIDRKGSPPTDSELSGLLRTIIRKDNDQATNDGAFAAIKARAAESEELHAQTVEMFRLMLSYRDRYGSEYAQGLAESFLDSLDGKKNKAE
jgi:hypothetical protein